MSVVAPSETQQEVFHVFRDFALSEQIQRNILEKGYEKPTPIQDKVIPLVLEGKDVVGMANTGTGKTAAFLIPLINKIFLNRAEKILIVAPTRELAVQIQEEAKTFAYGMHVYSVLCIGGVNMQRQIQGLRQNPNIVIGTPGRLKDLKNQGKLSIASFHTIVLDEVDRMLDMGFIADVKFIISHLPKQRQSLFFSATMSPAIKSIIETLSIQPTMVSVKSGNTARNVTQDIIKTQGKLKIDVLHDLLRQDTFTKVIIFGRTKWGIEKLSKQLLSRGLQVVALHGNKNQNQRQRALDQFKREEIQVLLGEELGPRLVGPYGFVFRRYITPGNTGGEIGVIGPARLNYTYVVPTVRYYGALIQEVAKGW